MAAEKEQLAIVAIEAVNAPFHKAWMKRIVKGVGKRHIHEVLAENAARKLNVECKLREAQILQTANEAEANETRAQLDQATQDVSKAIDAELIAARRYGKLRMNRNELSSQKLALRNQLLEAQKKVALIEVLAVSHAKLQEIKKQQVDATKAAEDAKKFVVEHSLQRKRLQKEVAEATRRAQAALNERMPGKRSPALWRGKSSKRLLRAVTYCLEEPEAKYPRKTVTYYIEEPWAKQPTLAKEIDTMPPSPSKRSDFGADEVPPTLVQPTYEVPPTLIQPTLSRRATMQAQTALSSAATETLLEDAQPYGSL